MYLSEIAMPYAVESKLAETEYTMVYINADWYAQRARDVARELDSISSIQRTITATHVVPS